MTAGWQDFTQIGSQFGSLDVLAQDSFNVLNPNQAYNLAMDHDYGGISISVKVAAAAVITVTVIDTTGVLVPWSQRQIAGAAGVTLFFAPPYAYTNESSPQVSITSSPNQPANSPTFILGYGVAVPGIHGSKLVRPDGRAYPFGAQSATATVAAQAGLRYLVTSALVASAAIGSGASGTVTHSISGTINGVVTTLAAAIGSTNGLFSGTDAPVWPAGLLLDVNTPLTFASSTSGAAPTQDLSIATVIFDTVT